MEPFKLRVKTTINQHNQKEISMNIQNKAKGFTLIEVVIGLGVFIAFVAFMFTFMGGANASVLALKESTLLDTIRGCAVSTKSGPDWAGMDEDDVIASNCLDRYDAINTAGDAILNTYGAQVTLAPVTYSGLDDAGLAITTGGYPPEACVTIATSKLNQYGIISINGTVVKTLNSGVIAPNVVSAACNVQANAMIFSFAR